MEDVKIAIEKFTSGSMSTGQIVSLLLGIVLACAAVYFSWRWNTGLGHNIVVKILFAIFAGLFNVIYLIFFVLIARSGSVTPQEMAGNLTRNSGTILGNQKKSQMF